jgi:hypothetical protein
MKKSSADDYKAIRSDVFLYFSKNAVASLSMRLNESRLLRARLQNTEVYAKQDDKH